MIAATSSHPLLSSIRAQIAELEAELANQSANPTLEGAVRAVVLETARHDPRMTPGALRILELLVPELHWGAFRMVKLGWLARLVGRSKSVTHRRVEALLELGYLESVKGERRRGLYRLALPNR